MPVIATPQPKPQRASLANVILVLCLTFAIVIEVFILVAERDMLRRMTPPEIAGLFGLTSLAWIFLLVELSKLPFAALMHVAKRRWWPWCLFATLIASVVSFEAIMVTASKVHEFALRPATLAMEEKASNLATIARLEQENKDLTTGAERLAIERDKVHSEADAEIKRREAALDTIVAGLQHELQFLASDSGDPATAHLRELQARRDAMQPPAAALEEVQQLDQRISELDARRTDEEAKGRAELAALHQASADRLDRARAAATRETESRRTELARRLDAATAERRSAEDELTAIAGTLAAKLKEADNASLFDRGRLRAEAAKAHQEAKALADSKRAAAATLSTDLERQLSDLGPAHAVAAASDDQAVQSREAALGTRLADLDAQRASVARQRDDRRAAMQANLDRDRASIDLELAALTSSLQGDVQSRARAINTRRQDLSAELARARNDAAAAIAHARQSRDARVTELNAAAVGPAEALRRTETNERAIRDARRNTTELDRQAVEARRGSPVVQLARVVSGDPSGEPTDADIQWTLRWLVPIVAGVVAVVPAILLKASLASILSGPSRRTRPWRAVHRLIRMRTARARRERAEAFTDRDAAWSDRDSALADAAAERDAAAAAAAAHDEHCGGLERAHATALAREVEQRTSMEARHGQELADVEGRAEQRMDAAGRDATLAIEACHAATEARLADMTVQSAAAIRHAEDRADVASRRSLELLAHAQEKVAAAEAHATQRVQAGLKSASRRMRVFRKRADVVAKRRVLRTIATQQGKIGALSQQVESLMQQSASLQAERCELRELLDGARDENMAVRRETVDLLRQIPTAKVTIDLRGVDPVPDTGTEGPLPHNK